MPSVPAFLGIQLPDELWKLVSCSTWIVKSNTSGTGYLYWAWSSELHEGKLCMYSGHLSGNSEKKKKGNT